jgi:hypothetical protein
MTEMTLIVLLNIYFSIMPLIFDIFIIIIIIIIEQ